MPNLELIAYPNYDPAFVQDFFDKRTFVDALGTTQTWRSELVKVGNVDLGPTDQHAAVECADGRSKTITDRELWGPCSFGQTNGVAALRTGGDFYGFVESANLIRRATRYNPGTHGAVHEGPGCGLFFLWVTKRLESAVHPFEMSPEDVQRYGIAEAKFIRALMRRMGGKHFQLPGAHVEDAMRYNPFIDTTEHMRNGSRFWDDDWFLHQVGVPLETRLEFEAEAVEKLKSNAAKIEILIS